MPQYQTGDRVIWTSPTGRERHGVIVGFDSDYRFNSGFDVRIRFDNPAYGTQFHSLLYVQIEPPASMALAQ